MGANPWEGNQENVQLDKPILFLFNSAAMKIGAEFHQQKSLREEAKWASLSVQILSSLKM